MKFGISIVTVITVLVIAASGAFSQMVAPYRGGEAPEYTIFDRYTKNRLLQKNRAAWVGKTQRARRNRQEYLASTNQQNITLSSLPDDVRYSIAVAGTLFVPVIPVKYNNTGADPFTKTAIQDRLFDNSSGTVTEYYDEVSYGNLQVTGEVFDWVSLAQSDTYYEGGPGCRGVCSVAKTGELILDALTARDAAIDFGDYDNDGPDGIPNSGDDDGMVDFVAFVQPETGGECGNNNIISHHFVVGGWPEFGGTVNSLGSPWQTNDAKFGGGMIEVWEYSMHPARGDTDGCGAGLTEIGVYCHEFGHAFGLPDLYGTDNATFGIGHWGIMGIGNENTPANPAHMCAWSKMMLGWVIPTEVGPDTMAYLIDNAALNPDVYKLDIFEEKFRRKTHNAMAGSYSMHCGLDAAEAAARSYPGGQGYGHHWNESIRRDFSYNGGGSVTLQYIYSYDLEDGYDFGYTKIDVGGSETVLASYTGNTAGPETIDLTPHLSGMGAVDYQIIFQLVSDEQFSDEDGLFSSGAMGPFIVDNIAVVGGGENYSTDFEQHEDGWYTDFEADSTNEFFLVEFRDKSGVYDQGLHTTGLAVWHIDQNVATDDFLNDVNATATNGIILEEADGFKQLLVRASRGDAGDLFPGSTSNTTFNNASNPNSLSHNGLATPVFVENIAVAGQQMSATMRGGWFPPTVSSVTPNTWHNNTVLNLTDIAGTGINHGATFLLRDSGGTLFEQGSPATDFPAASVEWVGKAKLTGQIDLNGLAAGFYDLVIQNPDGQEAVLESGFRVTNPTPVFIQGFGLTPQNGAIEIKWEIFADEAIDGFKILRRQEGSTIEKDLTPSLIDPGARAFVDNDVEPGTLYEYTLIVMVADGTQLRSHSASGRPKGFELALLQNLPNPFNPSTNIRFTLPSRLRVTLSVFDARGQRVVDLIDEILPAGPGDVTWDGRNDSGASVSSGVYFYRLSAGQKVLTRKMVLLK